MLCDCSVTAVGGDRLPSPAINNAVVSLAFSPLSLFSVASLSSLPCASTMGKNNKRKREPTPPSEEFGDSEYSEEEFSSESEGSPAPSPCVSRLTTQVGGWEPETTQTRRITPPLSTPSHQNHPMEELAHDCTCCSCPWWKRKGEEKSKQQRTARDVEKPERQRHYL